MTKTNRASTWICALALLIAFASGRFSLGSEATTQPNEPMVINTIIHNMTAKTRPPWCKVTSAGTLKGVDSGHFDRHYHDYNEYWLISRGKAKVWCDGKTFYVHAGDIFCIPAGKEHDILELYEPLQGFFFEDVTPPGGRVGHLHVSAEAAKGHPVPTLPVPADFPTGL